VHESLTPRSSVKFLALFALMFAVILPLVDRVYWVPVTLICLACLAQGLREGSAMLRSRDALTNARSEEDVEEIIGTPARRRIHIAYWSAGVVAMAVTTLLYKGAIEDTAKLSFFAGLAAYQVGLFPSIVMLSKRIQKRGAQPVA
jgi:hypothetical protein